MSSEFDDLISVDAVLQQAKKEETALRILLDKQREKSGHLLALRAEMGTTRSYVTTVTFDWVSQYVGFASELPIFKGYVDPVTKHVSVDEYTATLIQQRNPDHSRQASMVLYLARKSTHKFPPLLLVVTQPWVDQPESDKWDSGSRAVQDSISALGLDTHSQYFDVTISEERDFLYAIDGQHRLLAIKGLHALVKDGRIPVLKKDGTPSRKIWTTDDIIASSSGAVSASSMQQLMGERVGVEIIPAVCKGETRVEALRRLRSIFVHVNKTAKPLTKGEIAVLDEDNGFAVVARQLMVSHPLLRGRVHTKKSQLSESSPEFTTLETVVGMTQEYLSQLDEYADWAPDEKLAVPVRPAEDHLEAGYLEMKFLFDEMSKIPSLRELIQGALAKEFRAIAPDGMGNVLFRPIFQQALAVACGIIINEREMTMSDIMKKLARADGAGKLRCDDPTSFWYGPVYEPANKRMRRAGSTLITNLIVHAVAGGTPDRDKRIELERQYRESRTFDRDKKLAFLFDGSHGPESSITLPAPW